MGLFRLDADFAVFATLYLIDLEVERTLTFYVVWFGLIGLHVWCVLIRPEVTLSFNLVVSLN